LVNDDNNNTQTTNTYLNAEAFRNQFNESCLYTHNCTLNLTSDSASSIINANNGDDDMRIFVQYYCEMRDPIILKEKYDNLSLICVLIIFAGIFFVSIIEFIKKY